MFCKTCGRELHSEDVNMELAVAKCRVCHTVFGFAAQLEPGQPGHGRRQPQVVPLPDGIEINDRGPDLTIMRRWFSPAAVLMAIGCVVLFVFCCPGAAVFGPFSFVPLAIGGGVAYTTLANIVNRTVVRVTRGVLTVRHGPLPWVGNQVLSAAQVEQFYCTEHVRRNRNHGYTTTYRVNAIQPGGRTLKLLSGLTEIDQALFIEHTLEQHLGIRDRAVLGEIHGK